MTTIPATARFTPAYIIDRKSDWIYFLALPFAAVVAGLLAHDHLPGGAVAAVAVWITVPHHFVTWLRVYGAAAEFNRFRDRFIFGPVALIAMAYLAMRYAPLSLVLIVTLWDHQHSIMQQYGFARIYDFKAKAGSSLTVGFDLALNWVLFVNMLVVAPLWSVIWVRMLHEWRIPVSADSVHLIQSVSWIIAIGYLAVYVVHAVWCARHGHALNPMKYLFLFASYFLWYFTSFNTTYLLVWAVAHRIMHGVQYIVMVYHYMRNKLVRTGGDSAFHAFFVKPGNVKAFLLLCAAYALVYHALVQGYTRDFGFGIVGYNTNFDLFSYSLLSSFALLHYYYDAFIWKVRTKDVQEGL